MNKQKFLEEAIEELELDSTVDFDTNFKALPDWDSMNVMVLIGFVSRKFNISLNALELEKIDTFKDLISKIGPEKFDE
ncbi:MAG: acyl carrier protein [Cytophagaceae bacterium]|nr:acyl carrier protein [Cytophagaceae bacterium]